MKTIKRTNAFKVALFIVMIGCAYYLFRSPLLAQALEGFYDQSQQSKGFGFEDERTFLNECFDQHCLQLETAYDLECKKMKLRCSEEHMYEFKECRDDFIKSCDTSPLQSCLKTCKDLWAVEKENRVALSKTPTKIGIELQKEIFDVSIGSKTLPSPEINYFTSPVYTVSFFFFVANPSPSWRNMLYFTNPAYDRTPGIWVYPNEPLRIHFRHRSNVNWNSGLDTTLSMNFREWYHYTMVVDRNSFATYINGIPHNKMTLPQSEILSWGSTPHQRTFYLRHPRFLETQRQQLLVKGLHWFNEPLTESEAQAFYESKK